MGQTLRMNLKQVIQCSTAEDFCRFITAIIADTTPAKRTITLAHVGIKNIVSKGKFKKSKTDSPRENLPPVDAVISMKPLAAKPAAD